MITEETNIGNEAGFIDYRIPEFGKRVRKQWALRIGDSADCPQSFRFGVVCSLVFNPCCDKDTLTPIFASRGKCELSIVVYRSISEAAKRCVSGVGDNVSGPPFPVKTASEKSFRKAKNATVPQSLIEGEPRK